MSTTHCVPPFITSPVDSPNLVLQHFAFGCWFMLSKDWWQTFDPMIYHYRYLWNNFDLQLKSELKPSNPVKQLTNTSVYSSFASDGVSWQDRNCTSRPCERWCTTEYQWVQLGPCSQYDCCFGTTNSCRFVIKLITWIGDWTFGFVLRAQWWIWTTEPSKKYTFRKYYW